MGGNRATHVNPFVVNDQTVDIHITTRGSDWYWAVMSVMGFTMLMIMGVSFLRPPTQRIFHYILAAAAFVAMVEHYSMASNLGWVPIDVEWHRSSHLNSGMSRQIWWVRYCGWFLIWPLLSLSVLLTCAAPTVHILWACFLSAVMAIMAVVGAVVRSDYKWGYYGFWIWSWLLLVYCLLVAPLGYAKALGRDVQLAHIIPASWICLLWMLYPVCWGVSEGGNVIPPDSEFIFYGILDCCLIPITCGVFLWLHERIDPGHLGLYIRTYDDPVRGWRDPALVSGGVEKPQENGAPSPLNGNTGQPTATEPGQTVGSAPAVEGQEAV
ncbi:hypothetical protein BDV33DRAFT_201893 [Aspergillus novoparasiticus]|uniref:Heat shock protein 30 n=1 Tax=Aspergillus novoparasiticus TaxID=986946 RepID=A0A5N6EYB5_9EURO|nr:hypothetical protein BDV33DRAFT_201893 [Aspergillus novoparasiticus]